VTGGMGAGWVGTRSGEKCLSSSCAPAAGASERRSVHPGPSRARPRVAGPAGPGMLGPPALAVAVGGSRSRTRPAAHSHADFCNAWRGESQVAVCAVSRIRNGLVFFFERRNGLVCVSVSLVLSEPPVGRSRAWSPVQTEMGLGLLANRRHAFF